MVKNIREYNTHEDFGTLSHEFVFEDNFYVIRNYFSRSESKKNANKSRNSFETLDPGI